MQTLKMRGLYIVGYNQLLVCELPAVPKIQQFLVLVRFFMKIFCCDYFCTMHYISGLDKESES